jgi:chaperonin cofactor prefoldin
VEQLKGMLSDCQARLQQAQEQADVLAAERDAVARNLLRAEAELNDVSDYSTKMFRQVCCCVVGWGRGGGLC